MNNAIIKPTKYQFTLRTMFVLLLLAAGYWWLAAEFGFKIWILVTWLLCLILICFVLPRKNWRKVLLIFLGCSFLAVIFPPRVSRVGPTAIRTMQRRDLQNIALALTSFESEHGELPPPYTTDAKGNRLHSWRTLILPFLDNNLAQAIRYDEPWNSPYNSQFHKQSSMIFESYGSEDQECCFFAIVGKETAWNPNKQTSLQEIAECDGRSNTVLLMEIPNSGIHWMEPRDFEVEQLDLNNMLPMNKKLSAYFQPAPFLMVAFADCSIGKLTIKELTVENLKALCSINGKDAGATCK